MFQVIIINILSLYCVPTQWENKHYYGMQRPYYKFITTIINKLQRNQTTKSSFVSIFLQLNQIMLLISALNFFQILVLVGCFNFASGQQTGWKMTDRFNGFRYEITLSAGNDSFLDTVLQQANEFGCFGWVQQSLYNELTFVGEARCNKSKGPKFQDWFKHVANLKTITIKVIIIC